MITNKKQAQSGRSSRRILFLLAASAIGLLGAVSAQAQQVVYPLPFYEPFPSSLAATNYNGFAYENGEELGQYEPQQANGGVCSSNVWSFGNSISSSCIHVYTTNGQSGLEYPGLTNVDATYQTGLASTYIKDTSSTKNRGVPLAIPTNNPSAPLSVYASCLVNIQTNTFSSTTSPSPFFGLTQNTGAAASVNQSGAVIYIDPSLQLHLSKNSSTAAASATAPLSSNNTYLLVLRYKYNPTGPGTNADSVDLWVSPTALGGSTPPTTPTLTITNNNNVASNYFGGVALFEYANPCFLYIDEIRVGTNWAQVTPTNTPPGAQYSVTGGGACGDTSFPVGLSGSDTNVVYFLYTNSLATTNSVTGTGSAISFGAVSNTAVYTVLASNMTTGILGWMNGSAAVTVLSIPSITTEPMPVTVSSGELGAFAIGVSGGAASFQWYRGGVALTNGGEFSGVQTSNLIIFPATATDEATTANGYYVLVGNSCGTSVSSITNSLSLGSPANLLWFGGQDTNYWDVGITENWNTDTAFFNYGDNVTFDDTAATETVTLNNPNLSPSKITINGAGAYVFNGPGGLAGNGSIVMNSSGSVTLGLGLVNTESGGIIIGNSNVTADTTIFNFDQAGNLGTGVVTLAGGELAAGNVGQVLVDNEIDVTSTNSAIGVNSTGGQNLILTNIIKGLAGNLTIYNNTDKAATPSVEFQYPSFTFSLPIDLNVGGNGGGLYLEDVNASGVHVWSGIISDAGGVWRNASGGETLLTATNTFTGGTLLTLGPLGVATNSVIASGAVVAGPLGVGTLTVDTRSGSPDIFASGGPISVGNAITWYSNNVVGPAFVISGSNELSFSGDVDMNQTNRSIEVSNTASAVFSGTITDDGLGVGISIAGTGELYLDGTNIYTGGTTNSANLLAGTGIVLGPVVVQSGGAIGGGDPAGIGTFTIDNFLDLSGNVFVRVNRSLAQKGDQIVATGGATNLGSGTVTVDNIGAALELGDRFVIFGGALVNGGALTVTGAGVQWTNNLAVDGSISVLSLTPPPPPPTPTISGASEVGGNIVFSGTNGASGGTFYVLETTNIALPLADWTVVSTNTYGPGGIFSVTNSITPVPGKYFILEDAP
ncbi:MAG TPA: hypothetical protein VH619_17640 [Verrucomicrobiae bacterium]|nr:hypothetical protein [Verrucomicrobiae bacterium]